MDVEHRIDIETDLTSIVEEYVFPESPNQVQQEELVQEILETVVQVGLDPQAAVHESLQDGLEPVLTNPTPINRHRKPWSYSEIARLYSEYQIKRYTVDEIAEMHGRSYFAIVAKLKSANILYNVSDEEDEYFESEESDEDCDSDSEVCLTIQCPDTFLRFARAYCYVVESVVDAVVASVRYVYGVFVQNPRLITTQINKKKR
jgi:hypothetical protein